MRVPRWLVLLALASVAPATAQQRPVGEPTAAAAADSMLEAASQSRIKGAAEAPVTIVELSDFQCPFCREFALSTYPALDSAYIRTGKAKLIYVNLPLPMHHQAFAAAEAALCAGLQDRFWPMHDRIFAGQEQWSGSTAAGARFAEYAAQIGLDAQAFRECAADDRVAPLILGDVIQAAGAGAGSTPTFIINGTRVLSGARPFSDFQQAIEEALAAGTGR